MDIQVIEACTRLSTEEKTTFLEVVERLDQAGIESYTVNMLVPNAIYYAENASHTVPLAIKAKRNIATMFNQDLLIQALRAIQAKKIGYQEFLKRIMEAGVIFYLVFITGRKAIYFGRKGEQYLENFPPK